LREDAHTQTNPLHGLVLMPVGRPRRVAPDTHISLTPRLRLAFPRLLVDASPAGAYAAHVAGIAAVVPEEARGGSEEGTAVVVRAEERAPSAVRAAMVLLRALRRPPPQGDAALLLEPTEALVAEALSSAQVGWRVLWLDARNLGHPLLPPAGAVLSRLHRTLLAKGVRGRLRLVLEVASLLPDDLGRLLALGADAVAAPLPAAQSLSGQPGPHPQRLGTRRQTKSRDPNTALELGPAYGAALVAERERLAHLLAILGLRRVGDLKAEVLRARPLSEASSIDTPLLDSLGGEGPSL